MIFSDANSTPAAGIIMFVPSCARQGNDGGIILWEVYTRGVMFGGSNITETVKVTVKVQRARRKW